MVNCKTQQKLKEKKHITMNSVSHENLKELLEKDDDYLTSNEHDIIIQLGGIRHLIQTQLDHELNSNTSPKNSTDVKSNKNDSGSTTALSITSVPDMSMTNDESTGKVNHMHSINSNNNNRSMNKSSVENEELYSMTLYTSDNLIHSISTKKNSCVHISESFADKMSKFVHSKFYRYLVIILLIIFSITIFGQIVSRLPDNGSQTGFQALTILFKIIFTSLVIITILTFNQLLFWLELMTFDTLFKFYNACVLLFTVNWILRIDGQLDIVASIDSVIISISLLSLTLMLATIDAWGIQHKFKLGCLVFSLVVILWLYGLAFFSNRDIEFKLFGKDISVKRLFLNGVLNYAVFQAKQIYSMIKYPTKAGVVYACPTLNWVKDN